MTDTLHNTGAEGLLASDAPDTWGPPDAPLDMPCQDLTPRMSRFDLAHFVRQILPGLRV